MRKLAATTVAALLIAVLAAAGSMTTARPETAGATYVVRSGDTLGAIAARFGTSVDALARANGIANPNHIVVGSRLRIPAGGGGSGNGRAHVPAKLLAHPERLALRPHFVWWATYYGVPPDLVEALAWVESGWQRDVVSPTGAVGIGQLMPATVALAWKLTGVPLDPRKADDNIRMTTRFLRYLLDATGWVETSALAAYYQGLRAVREGPLEPEAVIYVATILAVRPSFR